MYFIRHRVATQEQANSFRDEMFVASLEPFTQTSLDFLQRLFDNDDDIFVSLTFDSFVALHSNSDSIRQNFDVALHISRTELKTQIHFDLCIFYLHVKKYDLARDNAIACRNNLADLKREYANGNKGTEFVFCTLNEAELHGCLLACGVADEPAGLLHRMTVSCLQPQQYVGLTDILREDNVADEIPLVTRRALELDIEAAARGGQVQRPILVQVAALNAIKSVLNEANLFSFNDFVEKYRADGGVSIVVEHVMELLPRLDVYKVGLCKKWLENVILSSTDWKSNADAIKKSGLFGTDEMQRLMRVRSGEEVVPVIDVSDWSLRDSKSNENTGVF